MEEGFKGFNLYLTLFFFPIKSLLFASCSLKTISSLKILKNASMFEDTDAQQCEKHTRAAQIRFAVRWWNRGPRFCETT